MNNTAAPVVAPPPLVLTARDLRRMDMTMSEALSLLSPDWSRRVQGGASLWDICTFHGIHPASDADIRQDPLWHVFHGAR